MTLEGKMDMLAKFFKGVSYSPTWYFGLGSDFTAVNDPPTFPLVIDDSVLTDVDNDTAERITTVAVDWPTTNDFVDAGNRQIVDFSAGAVDSGMGSAVKFAPPITNFTALLIAMNPNCAYLINEDGFGSSSTAVLHNVWNVFRPSGPTPPLDPVLNTPAESGDIIEVTIQLYLS